MNGTVEHLDSEQEAVAYRTQEEARTAKINADLADKMGQAVERIEQLAETFVKALQARPASTAAVIAPMSPEARSNDLEQHVDRLIADRKLTRTVQPNGDVSYGLPIEKPWDFAVAAVSDREAFIERSEHKGLAAHIEVTSKSDRAIEAAIVHAKAKWGNDSILIHAQEKHAESVVKYAVKHGLTIANTDSHTVALVKVAQERHRNPLTREHELNVPLLERVRS